MFSPYGGTATRDVALVVDSLVGMGILVLGNGAGAFNGRRVEMGLTTGRRGGRGVSTSWFGARTDVSTKGARAFAVVDFEG